MKCCNTHAGWEADVPVSTLSAPRTQTSSSVLCPSPDASVGSVQEEASARSVRLVTVCLLRGIYIYSHRMQSGGFWLSDWGSRRRWRNARFWFRWRPVRQTLNLKTTMMCSGWRLPSHVSADLPYPESSAWLWYFCRRRWRQVGTPHILQDRYWDETTRRQMHAACMSFTPIRALQWWW